MSQMFIAAVVLCLFCMGFGDRHQCQQDELHLRRQEGDASARNLDRTLGRKPGFVPIKPTVDREEWKAIQKMFVVNHGEDLGRGRDTSGWNQVHGLYDDIQVVTALRVKYTEETQSEYEKQKLQLQKEVLKNSKAFDRIEGLKTQKSGRLVRALKKHKIFFCSEINEQLLLHATKDANVLTILDKGLKDFRCGSWYCDPCTNSLFGCGVYLADEIEKADQYATPVNTQKLNYSTIDAIVRHQNNNAFLKDFLIKHNSHIFYAFIVKALLGKAKTVVRTTDRRQQHLDFRNGYFEDFKDNRLFGRTQLDLYHSQFIPSTRTLAKLSGTNKSVIERYNEVTSDALGRRTEILYVVAYTRCASHGLWQRSQFNHQKAAWSCDQSAQELQKLQAQMSARARSAQWF
eukprot:TRINITY_DN2242_c0_g1_i2.p1 TRINITY_DN2242_c0_g1~~TRINITY_DN2242_c0_g1_i2.p1  ORF type:complete len:402 (-),score=34.44 TRINITY_DN2242_c0_g1_i2:55-1260(-)